MSKITLDNYPAFFLDHAEGKLSVLDQAELLLFLELHPELKLELEEFLTDEIVLQADEVSFNDKKGLKREIPEENLVWYVEGTLNPREKEILEKELAVNAILVKEINLYKKTILQPETHIVFENKESLKHKTRIIPLGAYYAFGIAASILLVLGFFFLSTPDSTNQHAKSIGIAGISKIVPAQKSKPSIHKIIEAPVEPKNALALYTNKNVSKRKKGNVADIKTNGSPVEKELVTNTTSEIKRVPETQEVKKAEPAIENPMPTNTYFASNEEDEEELMPAQPSTTEPSRGRRLWSRASNLLASLKSLGAKNIDAREEKISENKTEYTFIVGKFEISKTKGAE